MNSAIGYLKSIFGNKIIFLYNEYEKNIPLYLNEQFVFLKFKINGYENKYILTQPKEKIEIKINTIRKQISQIKKFSDCIPVMVFDELRLTQRNALIQADFPFVVPNYQIYIPNVMFNLLEKDVIKKEYNLEFSVPTQVVFIHLLLNDIKEMNARKLLNDLPFSVATINRSLNELVARELLYTVGSNTRKIYRTIVKKEFWNKGKEFLFNPVAKTYYIKYKTNDFLMSNELALARLSWSLNDSRLSYYAVNANQINGIDDKMFIDKFNLFDDEYCVLEQFKYDPKILSNSQYIDVISLYAQFKDSKDERIQIALDEIIGEEIC